MLNINQHSLDSPPKELPIHALRWEVQKIIKHYAEVYQCPQDFITSAVFGIVGTMCGRHVTIFDGKYRNHPSLWICHVAPSGSNKSSPIKALMQPLYQEEGRRYKEFREKYKEFKRNSEAEEPSLIQLMVSDVTPEGLYKIFDGKDESKDGLLLYRDEIKGFIDDMGRYHNSGEVSNYLSIWDGTAFSVTRKTQPPIYIGNPFLCIMGGIQPDVFCEAFKRELAGIGFVQRWLFVYPDVIEKALYSETTLKVEYEMAWKEIFSKLLNISDVELTLSPGAKEVYIVYYNETIKRTDDSDSYMSSMLSKLRIYVLKWCAVTHILACMESAGAGQYFVLPSSKEISAEEMEYSVECMRYFEHCGTKALNLIRGDNLPKKLSQEQLVGELVAHIGVDRINITRFADALQVSRQYVSRIVNKKAKLRSCGVNMEYHAENQ